MSCGTIRKTTTGYIIKGDYSSTIITDIKLDGHSKISGIIYSRQDSTLLGSTNIIIDNMGGTQSNEKGEFEIETISGSHKLEIRHLGHDPLIIPELNLKPNEHAILIIQLGTSVIY